MTEYFDQIHSYFDSESAICSSWLANTLNVSVETACGVLETYLKSNSKSDIHVTYLITGFDKANQLRIAVVPTEETADYKTTVLKKLLSMKVYSIEKLQTQSLRSQIVDSCLQLADSLLKETSAIDGSFLTNHSGDINLEGLSVKGVGERIFSSQNLQYTKSLNSNSSTAKPVPQSATTTKSSAISGKGSGVEIKNQEKVQAFFGKTDAPSSSSTTTKVASSKSFFEASTNSTTKLNKPSSSQNSEENFETLKASNKAKNKVSSLEDDEEWDDGETPVVGTKRPAQEKIRAMLEDSDDDLPEAVAHSIVETSPASKKAKAAKPTNVNVRGAMDDFMEDAAIDQYKLELQQSGQKKKKKVLIEKVMLISNKTVCFVNKIFFFDNADLHE